MDNRPDARAPNNALRAINNLRRNRLIGLASELRQRPDRILARKTGHRRKRLDASSKCSLRQAVRVVKRPGSRLRGALRYHSQDGKLPPRRGRRHKGKVTIRDPAGVRARAVPAIRAVALGLNDVSPQRRRRYL